jgi:hypothetical protein
MKKSALLLACMAASHAFGSYELMFATDNVADKINRYDAISGAYLGSFGQGLATIYGRGAADPSKGIYYVSDLDTNRVLKFNYSTGEFLGSFGTGTYTYQCTLLTDGSVLIGGEGTDDFRRFTSTGTLLGTYQAPDGLTGICQAGNGFIYGVSSAGKILRYNFSGGAPTLITTLPNFSFALGIKALGNTLAVTDFNDDVTTTAFTVKTDGSFGSILGSANLGAGNGDVLTGRECAFGHGGLIYTLVTDYSTTKQYAYSWDPNTNFVARKLDLGINADAYGCLGLSTIVAPEPSTWVALGLGTLILVRRRK